MQNLTALILAAGANSRFFPLNYSTHKGAITLCGQPLILRTLQALQEVGIQKAVVVLSEKDTLDQGLQYFLQEQDLQIELEFVLQSEPKGMGDAVLQAKHVIGDHFLVTYPNAFDIAPTVRAMMNVDAPEVLCCSETDEPWLYGIATVEDGKATSIVEKPAPGQEPSNNKVEGLYVLSREFIEILETLPESEYNYEEALDILMKRHAIPVVTVEKSLLTLKYPWHLFETQAYLFASLQSSTHPEAKVSQTAIIDDSHGPVVIEAGAIVGDYTKIVGPCYIGRHTLVGDYSFVRGTCLEERAVIGANSEVVRSIILSGATLHYGYLADSIVGVDARIGAGLITANKRHDRKNIEVSVKDQKVDARRNALGVIIGDGAKVGIRTNTLPGKMIGAEAVIYPNITIYQNIPHQAIVKKKEEIEIV